MTPSLLSQPVVERVVLNAPQKEAVTCDQWPQLVFAGAGSGKTRVLTAKIAHLIEDCNVIPGSIFAATFTNKAASEMRERIEKLTNMPCTGLWIGTFHSLCCRILRKESGRLGYIQSFTIYDKDDQTSQVKKILKELGIDEKAMQPNQALGMISRYKNHCTRPSQLNADGRGFFEKEIVRVYTMYQDALLRQQAMDFDDLITNTVYLLRDNADVLEKYQRLFSYVLVDEYQDTNASQFQLIAMLAREHRRVFVVGDDDQSIYGWRGAQIENILSFGTRFPGSKIIMLDQNYRSYQTILNFANAVITQNNQRAEKTLWSDKTNGPEVLVTRYGDDRQEAAQTVEKICRLALKGINYGEMAILFRTNAQSRSFEEALLKRKVPYIVVGGMSFYERKEIKDCLAYLRLLVNPADDISLSRILNVPSRGIGDKTQETLITTARERKIPMMEMVNSPDCEQIVGTRGFKGISDFKTAFGLLRELAGRGEEPQAILKEMLTVTGYSDMLSDDDSEESNNRLENINEMINMLAIWSEENPEGTLTEFCEQVTLVADIDNWKQDGNSVNMMTMHCAKGLEFKAIFLVGLEDGIIPSRQNIEDPEKIEEECRLLYVGSTRAMESLECSYTDQRWRFGTIIPMRPSRFLKAVPQTMYRHVDMSGNYGAPKPRPTAQPTVKRYDTSGERRTTIQPQPVFEDVSQVEVTYRTGQHVTHKQYGQGKILDISGFGPDMRITVLFSDGARRKLLAKFANLERV